MFEPHPLSTQPGLRSLEHFQGARDHSAPDDRRRAVLRGARALHEELQSAPPVPFYAACDLVRAPYPLRYALRDATTARAPFIHILNRLFVVQCETPDGLKTLLVSPTDPERSAQTPFFARLRRRLPLRGLIEPLIAPIYATVERCLERLGLTPADVDYITYDHLHTQDLRGWLGTRDSPGLFPRAKLLVTRQEWRSASALLEPQRDWYVPGGVEGISPDRIVCFEGDVALGPSVVLMRTPGHTEGNHSIVVRTTEGILVTSENGVSADAYAPQHSSIPGLAAYARDTGMPVVLNGNTLEGGLDQYLSMLQEREVAGPSPSQPEFPNFVPSSELTPSWIAPRVRPSVVWGARVLGSARHP